MHTIITKKVTPKEMETLFERSDLIYIKNFKIKNKAELDKADDEPIKFDIEVRHLETDNLNQLFDNALSEIRLVNQ